MSTDLQKLKFNLQEKEYPYFEDSDLEMLLEQYTDVPTATYYGCLLKASVDSITVAGIVIPSNREYWLTLANQFKGLITTSTPQYNTSMRRVDGQ
ncbi:hypothetical protein [Clostridium sp. DJ247]|uniref:hypothetical protein n=1 Tax=Clostridium sp. DJ247 TaxID=2726188 RepID=UPI00162A3AFA|nr:hypothetical protein [Clostridium sp. DJ247]MBC2579990.1 hypothetical protein [Clostridium sp. DJ247]